MLGILRVSFFSTFVHFLLLDSIDLTSETLLASFFFKMSCFLSQLPSLFLHLIQLFLFVLLVVHSLLIVIGNIFLPVHIAIQRKTLVSELNSLLDNLVLYSLDVNIMLQRNRPKTSRMQINRTLSSPANPFCKFLSIGHCSTQHHQLYMFGQHYYSLFPNYSSIWVIQIMYFIEDHPFDLFYHFIVIIVFQQHISQYFCRHYQTAAFTVHLNIACNNTHIFEPFP